MVDGLPVESTGTRPSMSRNDAGAWKSPCVPAYSGWPQRSSAALRFATSGSPYVSSAGAEGGRPRSRSAARALQCLVMASHVGRPARSVTVSVALSGLGGPDPGGMSTLGSSRWLTRNVASGRMPGRSPSNVLNRSPMCRSSLRTGWLQFVSAVAPEKEQSHRSMPAVAYASSMICATSLPLSLQNGETDSKIMSNSSTMGDWFSTAKSNHSRNPGGGSTPYRRRYSSAAAEYVLDWRSSNRSKSALALRIRTSTGCSRECKAADRALLVAAVSARYGPSETRHRAHRASLPLACLGITETSWARVRREAMTGTAAWSSES
ncbi:hypothetical protein VTH06DRAFT_1001 [Thermothelomyces fergusii]